LPEHKKKTDTSKYSLLAKLTGRTFLDLEVDTSGSVDSSAAFFFTARGAFGLTSAEG
jgi:hypothetical protein